MYCFKWSWLTVVEMSIVYLWMHLSSLQSRWRWFEGTKYFIWSLKKKQKILLNFIKNNDKNYILKLKKNMGVHINVNFCVNVLAVLNCLNTHMINSAKRLFSPCNNCQYTARQTRPEKKSLLHKNFHYCPISGTL